MIYISEDESASLVTHELAFSRRRGKLWWPQLRSRAAFFLQFSGARGRRPTHSRIGDVHEKRAAGRRCNDEITVFGSSGISLQDLYMADALIRAKTSNG
jgi:ornithine cyclodeaminase